MATKVKKEKNQVGDILDHKAAVCREFDIAELHSVVAGSGLLRAGSWGFHDGAVIAKNKLYRFSVNGMHHKGYVYISLGWSDTFDIFYTDKKDKIKKVRSMVYIMDLIETLDTDIERISEYTQ